MTAAHKILASNRRSSMNQRVNPTSDYDEDSALAAFEGEGGALFDGPQVRTHVELPTVREHSQPQTRGVFDNAYVSGVIAAAIYDCLRVIWHAFAHIMF